MRSTAARSAELDLGASGQHQELRYQMPRHLLAFVFEQEVPVLLEIRERHALRRDAAGVHRQSLPVFAWIGLAIDHDFLARCAIAPTEAADRIVLFKGEAGRIDGGVATGAHSVRTMCRELLANGSGAARVGL